MYIEGTKDIDQVKQEEHTISDMSLIFPTKAIDNGPGPDVSSFTIKCTISKTAATYQ